MYIENKYNLKVGYGYRLLDYNEPFIKDDEYYLTTDCLGKNKWQFISSCNYGLTLAHFPNIQGVRRKIDVGEGYRLININEICEREDEYISYHYNGFSKADYWSKANQECIKVINTWREINTLGIAYRRKICNNNLLKQIEEEKAKVARLEKELANCKNNQTAEAQKENFKVGDYVIKIKEPTDNSNLYNWKFNKPEPRMGDICMIRGFSRDVTWEDSSEGIFLEGYSVIWIPSGTEYGFNKENWRKATHAEIEKHLLTEAAAKGFISGAKIQYDNRMKYSNNPVIITNTIKNLFVVFPDGYNGYDPSTFMYKEYEKNKPFVFIEAIDNGRIPINCESLSIIKDIPISITVDEGVYIAKFQSGFVEFGCAKIANSQIKHTLNLFNNIYNNSNRNFESVTIGKGIFTKEILEKLVTKLIG
jgi:hypothetical protein